MRKKNEHVDSVAGGTTPATSSDAPKSNEKGKWRRFKDALKRAFTPAPEDTFKASVDRARAKLQAWAARPADVMEAQRFCGRIVFWLVMITLLIAAIKLIDSAAFVTLLIVLALAVTLAVKKG